MAALTLDAAGVADLLGWSRRTGAPYTEKVIRAYRDGWPGFPAPINATLHARSWRWSRVQVEAYGNGERSTAA
jgi:hypothetical protein